MIYVYLPEFTLDSQQKGVYPDLVATSGDYLRVWRVSDSDVRLECLLNNVRKQKCLSTIIRAQEQQCVKLNHLTCTWQATTRLKQM